MHLSRLTACLLLASALQLPAQVDAREISGVNFVETMTFKDHTLPLRSVGLLRQYFLKGYVAALYMPEPTPVMQYTDDVPKCLVLEYFWDIPGNKFAAAGEEVMRRMVDEAVMSTLRERLDTLAAAYQDVKEGDRYSLCYAPDNGTSLIHNDESLISVPGADFSAAYFSIWLGEKSIDGPLRKQLTGG